MSYRLFVVVRRSSFVVTVRSARLMLVEKIKKGSRRKEEAKE
jgi:hypothetical protein